MWFYFHIYYVLCHPLKELIERCQSKVHVPCPIGIIHSFGLLKGKFPYIVFVMRMNSWIEIERQRQSSGNLVCATLLQVKPSDRPFVFAENLNYRWVLISTPMKTMNSQGFANGLLKFSCLYWFSCDFQLWPCLVTTLWSPFETEKQISVNTTSTRLRCKMKRYIKSKFPLKMKLLRLRTLWMLANDI